MTPEAIAQLSTLVRSAHSAVSKGKLAKARRTLKEAIVVVEAIEPNTRPNPPPLESVVLG